ncbi:hypothetical protein HDU67_009509, partial [Dinochytrium kinnereticum]
MLRDASSPALPNLLVSNSPTRKSTGMTPDNHLSTTFKKALPSFSISNDCNDEGERESPGRSIRRKLFAAHATTSSHVPPPSPRASVLIADKDKEPCTLGWKVPPSKSGMLTLDFEERQSVNDSCGSWEYDGLDHNNYHRLKNPNPTSSARLMAPPSVKTPFRDHLKAAKAPNPTSRMFNIDCRESSPFLDESCGIWEDTTNYYRSMHGTTASSARLKALKPTKVSKSRMFGSTSDVPTFDDSCGIWEDPDIDHYPTNAIVSFDQPLPPSSTGSASTSIKSKKDAAKSFFEAKAAKEAVIDSQDSPPPKGFTLETIKNDTSNPFTFPNIEDNDDKELWLIRVPLNFQIDTLSNLSIPLTQPKKETPLIKISNIERVSGKGKSAAGSAMPYGLFDADPENSGDAAELGEMAELKCLLPDAEASKKFNRFFNVVPIVEVPTIETLSKVGNEI